MDTVSEGQMTVLGPLHFEIRGRFKCRRVTVGGGPAHVDVASLRYFCARDRYRFGGSSKESKKRWPQPERLLDRKRNLAGFVPQQVAHGGSREHLVDQAGHRGGRAVMPGAKERGQQDHKIIVVEAATLDFHVGETSKVILAWARAPLVDFTDGDRGKRSLFSPKLLGIALRCEHFDGGLAYRWNERVIDADESANRFGRHGFGELGDDVTGTLFDKGIDVGIDVRAHEGFHFPWYLRGNRGAKERTPCAVPGRIHLERRDRFARQHGTQHLGLRGKCLVIHHGVLDVGVFQKHVKAVVLAAARHRAAWPRVFENLQ